MVGVCVYEHLAQIMSKILCVYEHLALGYCVIICVFFDSTFEWSPLESTFEPDSAITTQIHPLPSLLVVIG